MAVAAVCASGAVIALAAVVIATCIESLAFYRHVACLLVMLLLRLVRLLQIDVAGQIVEVSSTVGVIGAHIAHVLSPHL